MAKPQEHNVSNYRKRNTTLSVPSKMGSDAQNMKTGPDTLGTAENRVRKK
jgi:hypothetical protein